MQLLAKNSADIQASVLQVQLVEVLKGLMALPPETQAALMQLINTPNLAAVPQMEVRLHFASCNSFFFVG